MKHNRMSIIVHICAAELYNNEMNLLSGKYYVTYSSGVSRCFPYCALTKEMCLFMLCRHRNGKRKIAGITYTSDNKTKMITDYVR